MSATGLTFSSVDSLSGVARADWDGLANPPGAPFDPFVSWDFLEALERSGCASRATGWAPRHLLAHDATGRLVGAAPLYLKSHSYGEYVFDHAWADALTRAGGRYYPKLQCAAPFTPATGRRLLARDGAVQDGLAAAAVALARQLNASSLHVTFPTAEQAQRLAAMGFMLRTGLQFHWSNAGYRDFTDFLAALSSAKRKMIRRERERALDGVTVRELTGGDIVERDWDVFFDCYMDTGSRKWGRPYLNRDAFALIGERMKERIVLFIAERAGAPVAAALNFLGGDCLYGRYWGRLEDLPFLHFELCYYRAIELAIRLELPRVEAGAQGEHKLARGYAPAATHSAHWIAHPGLSAAVEDYLARERPAVAHEIEDLAEHAPFRKD